MTYTEKSVVEANQTKKSEQSGTRKKQLFLYVSQTANVLYCPSLMFAHKYVLSSYQQTNYMNGKVKRKR
jgi:hypothetical protein